MNTQTAPFIEVQSVSKIFGSVIALKDISMKLSAGELVCLLCDNGAGKSTLIKILSGVHQPSEGSYLFEGEPTKGWGPFRLFNVKYADQVTREELAKMGTQVRETTQPVGRLSGVERQSVAISRAVYFGAKVLILDEPTAALGVKEAGVVLRYIAQARSRGLRVIFITHNPHHAYPIGDHFTILTSSSGCCPDGFLPILWLEGKLFRRYACPGTGRY
jgi:simple sugar transport system ATP-binding protein